MKNILVTGGAGFIGSNFIRHLLKYEKDIQIYNFDKLTYAGSMSNLLDLMDTEQYHFIKGDICDETLVESTIAKNKIDTIVHFAAESHVDRSIATPIDFIDTNIRGTFVLLEAARKNKIDRFHHISTDEVYGSLNLEDAAFTEKSTYTPRSPYSASKASSDHLVMAYHHTYDLPVTLSNCSNNYGPYQHVEKFIPTVIRSAITNKAIPIYGQGKNIRDWLHVEDHCNAVRLILKTGKNGECYNIGGDNELDNLTLAQYICTQLDSLTPKETPHANLIQFVTDRAGHDFRYAIDSTKIRTELGWVPKENFAEGMLQTIKFYFDRINSDCISEKPITLLRPVSFA